MKNYERMLSISEAHNCINKEYDDYEQLIIERDQEENGQGLKERSRIDNE
jgi:hypothetical protein